MVQEDAQKVSRRARRRAASNPEGTGEAESDESGEVDAPSGEAEAGPSDDEPGAAGKPGAGATQNRKARRGAAAQARARRKREQAEAQAVGLDAGEMVDDALVRATDRLSRFIRHNWNVIQWTVGLGVLGWIGWQVYAWYDTRQRASISDALMLAAAAESGRIGDPSERDELQNGVVDPTPIFDSEESLREATLEKYRKAVEVAEGRPAAAFAKLGEAGTLLEMGRTEEAQAAYEAVRRSEASQQSSEILGAALGGLGLSLEARKDVDGALSAFEKLASVPGFEERALLQQARIQAAAGKTDEAKTKLGELFKKLGPPPSPVSLGAQAEPPRFLRTRAEQLSRQLDPLEKDVKIPRAPMGSDTMQKLLEQVKQQGLLRPPEPTP